MNYIQRCSHHYRQLVEDGHDPRAPGFATLLCRRLRTSSGATGMRRLRDPFGGEAEVETWRASGAPVPEWFAEVDV